MVTRHDVIQSSEATTLSGKIGLILGGLPEDNDTLPSVLFITLYAALFIPVIWRIQKHTLTFGQVWKPLLVIMLRVATFALRIKLSDDQDWSQDIIVTQLILLRLGPIILTSALICLLRDAVIPYLPTLDAPNMMVKFLLKYFVALLNMATYFAFGLTIAIAFDVKAAINGNGEARIKMHVSKQISIWMLVGIDACIYILVITPIIRLYQKMYIQRLIVSQKKEESKFLAIASVCTFLLVVSAFKALQLAAHGRFTSRYALVVNKKILFYCVCCAGEYIACMLLVALPWARMVPPPEILEAFCRVYSSNDGSNGPNGGGPNATITQTAVIPWPKTPPAGKPSDGTGIPIGGGTNSEYFTNHPEGGGGVGTGSRSIIASNDPQLRAPGGLYGDQMKEIIPKHATIHRITIPEDFSKHKQQQQQSYPRQLLLSPSSSPLKEKFNRNEEERNSNSQPLPVFVHDTSTFDEQQQQQQPKRNSRSFVFSSGGGIQPMGYNPSVCSNNNNNNNSKRASLLSLSTISEVGDDGGSLGNIRSIYRNSIWHPRNSMMGDSHSPLSIEHQQQQQQGEGEDDDDDGEGNKTVSASAGPPLHHTSWESTHSSTHSALSRTISSDSISLPPHLIPIAPPKSAPLPAPITPTSLTRVEKDQNQIDQDENKLINIPLQQENNENNHKSTSSLFASTQQGSQPKLRQLSTCSVRSHWSDDSDHGIAAAAAANNNKNYRYVGTLRGRREGGKSSTRADSLEWD